MDFSAESPRPAVSGKIAHLRMQLWEVRTGLIRAMSSCTRFDGLWATPPLPVWLKDVTAALPKYRPNLASLLLKDVLDPVLHGREDELTLLHLVP
eukprot:2600426-Amphidinium_carterae.1